MNHQQEQQAATGPFAAFRPAEGLFIPANVFPGGPC
jgi:hypothetical protein